MTQGTHILRTCWCHFSSTYRVIVKYYIVSLLVWRYHYLTDNRKAVPETWCGQSDVWLSLTIDADGRYTVFLHKVAKYAYFQWKFCSPALHNALQYHRFCTAAAADEESLHQAVQPCFALCTVVKLDFALALVQNHPVQHVALHLWCRCSPLLIATSSPSGAKPPPPAPPWRITLSQLSNN